MADFIFVETIYILFFFRISCAHMLFISSKPVSVGSFKLRFSCYFLMLLVFFFQFLTRRHATSSLGFFLILLIYICDIWSDFEWLKTDFDTIIRPKMKIVDKHESELVGLGLNFFFESLYFFLFHRYLLYCIDLQQLVPNFFSLQQSIFDRISVSMSNKETNNSYQKRKKNGTCFWT